MTKNNPLITKIRESEEESILLGKEIANETDWAEWGIDEYEQAKDFGDKIKSFHRSYLISLLEENIKRLEGKRIICINCFPPEGEEEERKAECYGYDEQINDFIDKEINFYQQTIDELKKHD